MIVYKEKHYFLQNEVYQNVLIDFPKLSCPELINIKRVHMYCDDHTFILHPPFNESIINVGVCSFNVYFPMTSFPLLQPLLGSILVAKDLLTGDYKYQLPLPGLVTFALTTSKNTSMLILSFKSILCM